MALVGHHLASPNPANTDTRAMVPRSPPKPCTRGPEPTKRKEKIRPSNGSIQYRPASRSIDVMPAKLAPSHAAASGIILICHGALSRLMPNASTADGTAEAHTAPNLQGSANTYVRGTATM